MIAATRLHVHAIADLASSVDVVVGIESRGFLYGIPLATEIGAAFAPVVSPAGRAHAWR